MSNVAVVYWSDTGNTEAMARFVAEGIQSAGGKAEIIAADGFGPDKVSQYDAIAFGCPAMGDEILEEDIFEPMLSSSPCSRRSRDSSPGREWGSSDPTTGETDSG